MGMLGVVSLFVIIICVATLDARPIMRSDHKARREDRVSRQDGLDNDLDEQSKRYFERRSGHGGGSVRRRGPARRHIRPPHHFHHGHNLNHVHFHSHGHLKVNGPGDGVGISVGGGERPQVSVAMGGVGGGVAANVVGEGKYYKIHMRS